MCLVHWPSAALLQPEDAVIVRHGGDDIVASVAVHVVGVDEAGVAQIEIRMPLPVAGARIGRRFEPALGRDDIVAAVAVHIARADAVALALRADHVFHELAVLRLVPGQRLFVSPNCGSTS